MKQSFVMLRPDIQWKNPVMFVVEVGTVLTILFTRGPARLRRPGAGSTYCSRSTSGFPDGPVRQFRHGPGRGPRQGPGRRPAEDPARDARPYRLRDTTAAIEETVSTALKAGDRVVVEAGQVIPGDGEIIEGVASVDESAITGESAPVIREAGGDRSGVTGGTRVLSDRIVVRDHGRRRADRSSTA